MLFVAMLGITAACPPAPGAESKIKSEELSARLLNTLHAYSDHDLAVLAAAKNYDESSITESKGVIVHYYDYCTDVMTPQRVYHCVRRVINKDVGVPQDSLGKACLGVVPVNGVDSIVDLSLIQAGGSLADSEIKKAAFFAALQRAAAWIIGQRAHDQAEAQEVINRKKAQDALDRAKAKEQEALDRAKALADKYCPDGKCALPN
jgi:hypothetical protein